MRNPRLRDPMRNPLLPWLDSPLSSVIRGVGQLSLDGLLNHFEVMTDATHIESAIGPDIVKTAAGTLSSATKKFGSNALNGTSGVETGNASGILGSAARNWRAECWGYCVGGTFNRSVMKIQTSAAPYLEIGSYFYYDDSAAYVAFQNGSAGGGGRYGFVANRPTPDALNHFCIQYEHPNNVTIYINGKNILHDFTGGSGGAVEHFRPLETWFASPQVLSNISVFGIVDEFYLYALPASKPLYENQFAVPTVPFTGYEY